MPILTIIRVGHFCRSRNQKPPRLSLLNSRIDLNNPSKCSLCTILFNELLDIMLIKFDLHSILTFTSQSKQFYEVRTILRTQTTFLLYQKRHYQRKPQLTNHCKLTKYFRHSLHLHLNSDYAPFHIKVETNLIYMILYLRSFLNQSLSISYFCKVYTKIRKLAVFRT